MLSSFKWNRRNRRCAGLTLNLLVAAPRTGLKWAHWCIRGGFNVHYTPEKCVSLLNHRSLMDVSDSAVVSQSDLIKLWLKQTFLCFSLQLNQVLLSLRTVNFKMQDETQQCWDPCLFAVKGCKPETKWTKTQSKHNLEQVCNCLWITGWTGFQICLIMRWRVGVAVATTHYTGKYRKTIDVRVRHIETLHPPNGR